MKFKFQLIAISLLLSMHVSSFGQTTEWMVTNPAIATDICIDVKGNTIATGFFNSSITIGGQVYNTRGQEDIMVVKYGDNGNIMWSNQIGGAGSDSVKQIIYDGQGNVWVTGSFTGSIQIGSSNYNSNGASDAYIAKLSASTGKVLFATNIGSTGNDVASGIGTDKWGNIYISGNYNGTVTYGSVTLTTQPGANSYVIKMDQSGNPYWGKTINGSAAAEVWNMAVDDMGSMFITGYCGNGSSLNITGTVVNPNFDTYITSLDSSGTYKWYISAMNAAGKFTDISTDNAGNAYFIGYYIGQNSQVGQKTVQSSYMQNLFIGKINNSGNCSWVQPYGNSLTALVLEQNSIDVTDDGKIFACGLFEDSVYFGAYKVKTAMSTFEGFVVKLDSTSNVMWAAQTDGSKTTQQWLSSISANNNGEVCVAGYGTDTLTFGNFVVKSDQNFLIRFADSPSNILEGYVFIDKNGDGKMNGADQPIKNSVLALDITNVRVATDSKGHYKLYSAKGQHTIAAPNPPKYHTYTTPSSYTVNHSTYVFRDTSLNFGFAINPNINDLKSDITPISFPRVGRVAVYQVTYSNVGTSTLSPTVTFSVDTMLKFASATPVPASQNGNTFTWNAGSLNPGGKGVIKIEFNVPTYAQIGDPVFSTCTTGPTSNDTVPNDNSDTLTVPVFGPYDPNFKTVDIDTLYNVSSPDWLEYTIHFQNLGNDTAFNVHVSDTLSQYVDPSTIEIISSSADVNLVFKDPTVVEFRFNNIMLPDSATDPEGSNGFVKYRVKYLSSLPVNNSIENFADIYFDYNPAVRTDTAHTIYIYPAAVTELTSVISGFNVYPNPSSGIVNVHFETINNGLSTIALYDITGQIILQKQVTAMSNIVQDQINLSYVKPGAYILVVKQGNEQITSRIIKR